MPGRFPLFTDNHVREQLADALRRQGWDVVRAIDVFSERTPDGVLFEYAAEQGRVFVTNDEGVHRIAADWLAAGWSFRMAFWRQVRHRHMPEGRFVQAFEELAQKPNAFAYPIEYIKPLC